MSFNKKSYNLIKNATDDLGHWSHKSTPVMLGGSFILVLILVGGLLFWADQFSYGFGGRSSQSQLDLANSGLQTMKRMVGDQQVWSQSIKQEYKKIIAAQLVGVQPISYNSNFISQDPSTEQLSAK